MRLKKFLINTDLNFFFTDNHSTDDTFMILKDLAAKDKRIKVIRFTKILAFRHRYLLGTGNAAGDAAIQIDCDLQKIHQN